MVKNEESLLSRFQRQTRRKADPGLIENWEWRARWHGDQDVKKELSNVKRTATTMQRAKEQFSHLKPEHRLALDAAASAMRSLAAELEALAAWAREYRVFCHKAMVQAAAAELEAFAAERWPTEEAFRFERDLVTELRGKAGQLEFGRWMHSIGRETHIEIANISCPVRNYGGSRPDAISIEAATTERTKIALEIHHAKDASRLPLRGTNWMVGTVADYEAYLVYRKEVAETSARILQMASVVDPGAH